MKNLFYVLLFLLTASKSQAQHSTNYFEYLKKTNLYVESIEPPQQFFFQSLAFKKKVGDTTIAGEKFAIIQFQRFLRDDNILDNSRLYEHISPIKYVLLDKAFNNIHNFNINQDSTENGYIFGWKGTVKRRIKSQNPVNNKIVADYYLARDTNEVLTFNQYLENIENYQRGVNFTKLLVGSYSSDFVESAQEKRIFKPNWTLQPGDEFETTLYEMVYDEKTADFTKKPNSIIKLAYVKDSILEDMPASIINLSTTNLETQFTEVKPDLYAFRLDTCWYLTSNQLILDNQQNTYAWLRNLNEKSDSIPKKNPFNLEDDFNGQFVVLNYVNKGELDGENFTVNHFFKSNQPGLFAQYDFLPIPIFLPNSFHSQLNYLKKGNIIKGKKHVEEFKGKEPILTKFKAQSKKIAIDIYFPENSTFDLILAPYVGNKKLKTLTSTKTITKGTHHFEWEWNELENLSYYYIYINVKFIVKFFTKRMWVFTFDVNWIRVFIKISMRY